MTDQPQSEPPAGAGEESEPTVDVAAVPAPDAPSEAATPEPEPTAVDAAVVTPAPPLPPEVTARPPVPSPPVDTAPPPVPSPPEWRPEDEASAGGPAALAAERPEIAVGAAFAGGLVLALILKRLAR